MDEARPTQQQIKLAVTEAMRGGFTLHVTQVRENRAYLESRKISVPWKNKELALTWEHFTSKLQPGQKETWTLQSSQRPGPGAGESRRRKWWRRSTTNRWTPLRRYNWPHGFWVFREDYSTVASAVRQLRQPVQSGLRQLDSARRRMWRSLTGISPLT